MITATIQHLNTNDRKAVLVGTVRFCDLIDKIRISYRKDKNDPKGTFEEYQRRVDKSRLSDIASYIKRSIIRESKGLISPIFPTSIILAASNEAIDFESANGFDTVSIEEIPFDTLIVDGQHRFFGMLKLFKEVQESLFKDDEEIFILKYLKNYKFNCTILVNFDVWEQAQVFASVNFNQKKVNKSLFYNIYGIMIPDDSITTIPQQNEIYIAHQLVKYLDSSNDSPFKGFVRMLGKGKGFVSQAFFVERILDLLQPDSMWADVAIDIKQNRNSTLYNYAARELTAYLAAIRFTFKPYWPETVDHTPKTLLCKTTGIGAIMRLFVDVHNSIPNNLINKIKEPPYDVLVYAELVNTYYNKIRSLESKGKEFFEISPQNIYSGGAGSGMQKKLYDDMYDCWIKSTSLM